MMAMKKPRIVGLKKVRIVGLGGSLAAPSRSLAALKIALAAAKEAGATTRLFDLKTLDFPMYSPATKSAPESVKAWAEAVHAADGLLWSSPLYHGTISGSFKNALDWLQLLIDRQPPLLTDKVVGLISAAGGSQGLQAVNTMEFIVRALRGWAVPLVIPIAEAWRVFDAEGQTKDTQVVALLRTLGQEVVRVAGQFARDQLGNDASAAAGGI